MKRLALLALIAAGVFAYLRQRQPLPPAPAPAGGEAGVDADGPRARDGSTSFAPVCSALRKDLARVDQPLEAPRQELQYAHRVRQRVQANGAPRPEHATLVQICDLLICANEERDAERASLQTQVRKPYLSPLDARKRGESTPDPRPELTARLERRWGDYRQQTTATAARLLAGLENRVAQ